MRYFSRLILLLCLPCLILYPCSEAVSVNESIFQEEIFQIPANHLLSCDDILDLLEEIEEGNIEERCSSEDLEKINRFVVLLANEGISSSDSINKFIVEDDSYELLYGFRDFYLEQDYEYIFSPVQVYDTAEIILCKSWVKKNWQRTKKFVRKHKKEIIIGALVVVSVVAIVAASVAISASAASAASAATIDKLSSSEKVATEEVISSLKEDVYIGPIIEEHTDVIKESLNRETEIPFTEKLQYIGARCAHQAFEGVTNVIEIAPQALDQLKKMADHFFPDDYPVVNENFITNGYKKTVEQGHLAIDKVFSTNQASIYIEESSVKELQNPCLHAFIPVPSVMGVKSTTSRISITQASSIKGWSIGQPINNRTIFGTVPKWSTVRRRYWKNKAEWAKSNPGRYEPSNIERMERGLAPQRKNNITGQIDSMELHHDPSQKEGGLFDFIEVWPDEHALIDPSRRIGN